jgi:hypothetical protein
MPDQHTTPESYLLSLPVGTALLSRNGETLMVRTADGFEFGEDDLRVDMSDPLDVLDCAAELLCTTIGITVA